MKRIGLAPGKPYSPALAESDRQALLAAYNDLGFLWAQVAVRVGSPDEAHFYPIEFQIREGARSFVERIHVLGNERTRSSVVQKRIRLEENEPLSLGKMLQTQQGLYGLGVFDQVRVAQQNSESTAPFQDVVVRLRESKRFTMRYGLGYQEREKLRGTLEFTHDNILGLARRAQFRIRGSSIEQQAIFTLQQPQFRPIPVDSNFTFSFQNKQDVSYDSRRFNISYQFSHPFGGHAWGMLRYQFQKRSDPEFADLGIRTRARRQPRQVFHFFSGLYKRYAGQLPGSDEGFFLLNRFWRDSEAAEQRWVFVFFYTEQLLSKASRIFALGRFRAFRSGIFIGKGSEFADQ